MDFLLPNFATWQRLVSAVQRAPDREETRLLVVREILREHPQRSAHEAARSAARFIDLVLAP